MQANLVELFHQFKFSAGLSPYHRLSRDVPMLWGCRCLAWLAICGTELSFVRRVEDLLGRQCVIGARHHHPRNRHDATSGPERAEPAPS
jgi:hypothetical protein